MALTRRRLLASTPGLALAAAAGLSLPPGRAWAAAAAQLTAASRIIEVQGRAARVYGLRTDSGWTGLAGRADGRFRVRLSNELADETLIHWHGLTPPSEQDGVPGLSQPPIAAGASYDYDFPQRRAGTFWMHSHVGLQRQKLLAAPLIVRTAEDEARDEQEVVVLFHDFSFREPEEILQELRGGAVAMAHHGQHGHMAMGEGGHQMTGEGGHDMSEVGHGMSEGAHDMSEGGHGMSEGGHDKSEGGHQMAGDDHTENGDHTAHGDHGGMVHFNDVDFDAYLANDRTLADPEVVAVEPGGRLRLRLINAAAATNFIVDLGSLTGSLIAVDGNPVAPIAGHRFDLAMAQRLDLRLTLPAGQGLYYILARREGERAQTGIALATKRAEIKRLPELSDMAARPLDLALERQLRPLSPLAARPADRRLSLALTGRHRDYVWGFEGAGYDPDRPLAVREGERVEIEFVNRTGMPHPMHLHGHHFQVVAIDGDPLPGALRDTILVPARRKVTIAFDADNPGHWAFHCHQLYHMHAGMMTSLRYEGYQPRS